MYKMNNQQIMEILKLLANNVGKTDKFAGIDPISLELLLREREKLFGVLDSLLREREELDGKREKSYRQLKDDEKRISLSLEENINILQVIFGATDTLKSRDLVEELAYFTFLVWDVMLVPLKSVHKWVEDLYKNYHDSGFIEYVYLFFSQLAQPQNYQPEQLQKLFFGLSQDDLEFIIRANEKYTDLVKDYYKKRQHLLENSYEAVGKLLFPNVSLKSFMDAIISFRHATLAEFYLLAKKEKEYAHQVEESLRLWRENPYALIEKGFLKKGEDSIEAIEHFNKALKLLENNQLGSIYNENGIVDNLISGAHTGLGLVFRSRKIYDYAEVEFTKALDTARTEFSKAVPLLNRGVNRIDMEDYLGAIKDLTRAKDQPHTRSKAHTNIGVMRFNQGLYDQAEEELIQAIKIQLDNYEAYYNLGVLYNAEGKKDRARTLFKTAIDYKRDYKKAREDLKKLEESEIKGLKDWYEWWFGSNATSWKKILGLGILGFLFIIIVRSIYDAIRAEIIPDTSFYLMGIAIVILVLSTITKLKVGLVELEMQTVEEQPSQPKAP
jgi:tetratricopeptide (TPR) repeat protein